MIDLLLRDSLLYPSLFLWKGPLSVAAIEQWERVQSLTAPDDLKRLWCLKGGCDLFESETILQPFGADEYDLVGSASSVSWEKGLSKDYCVFHTGIVDTVFRKVDGAIFTLEASDLKPTVQFQNLDQWYSDTLRSAFAERYGLPATA